MAILIAHPYASLKITPRQAPEELKALMKVFENRIACEERARADRDVILDAFKNRLDPIEIFHFAGHALGKELVVNHAQRLEEKYYLDMEHFAAVLCPLAEAKALKLVFLNACNTEKIADYLIDHIPVVVGTTIPVNDTYAFHFAKEFYQAFVAEGKTLREALFIAHKMTNSNSAMHLLKPQAANPAQLEFDEQWLDQDIRGLVKTTPAQYQLDQIYKPFYREASAAYLDQTLKEWIAISPASPTETKTAIDTAKVEDRGIPMQDRLLYCDRKEQIETVENLLNQITGAAPKPGFVFFNAHLSDCVPEFLMRVERMVQDTPWPKLSPVFTRMSFLEEKHLRPENGGNSESAASVLQKGKLRLQEIFQRDLKKPGAPPAGGDLFYVLYHEIYPPFWSDQLHALFDYYICDLFQEQGLGKRVLVLFFLMHEDEPQYQQTIHHMAQLYEALKTRYGADAVAYFDQMPKIGKPELLEWYRVFFSATLPLPIRNKIPAEGMFFEEASVFIQNDILSSLNPARTNG